jgi:hypothetical protein
MVGSMRIYGKYLNNTVAKQNHKSTSANPLLYGWLNENLW